eukprot:EG_transcript_29594
MLGSWVAFLQWENIVDALGHPARVCHPPCLGEHKELPRRSHPAVEKPRSSLGRRYNHSPKGKTPGVLFDSGLKHLLCLTRLPTPLAPKDRNSDFISPPGVTTR